MISKQAFELVERLNHLKNSEQGKQSRKIHAFGKSIEDYRQKSTKCISDLDEKITSVEQELKSIRNSQKRQQELAVKRVDEFESDLKRLIESYQSEANQANKKLTNMVETIKQSFKASYQESLKGQKTVIDRMKTLSVNLSLIIDSVRRQQKSSIDKYQSIKNIIRQKSSEAIYFGQRHIAQMNILSQKLIGKIEEIERKAREQIGELQIVKQSRVRHANKLINTMIDKTTNN